ncbi:MAG: iron-containing alcohol dehydrogenase [Amphiplicatus sp.]
MALFATTRAPRHIVVGAGQRHSLGHYARSLGAKALICTDERMGADKVLHGMVDSLASAGVESIVYDRTLPEVPMSSISECLELAKPFSPDMVIGIGGGSCLDIAKVASVLLAHGGEPKDYYGEFKVPGPTAPLIAIPTTAGTGSEVTPVAVVADPEKTLKVGIASPELIPHIALCDPELTLTCPPGLTAASGSDAMTHAVEAFMAARREPSSDLSYSHVFLGKNSFSDMYALRAISYIATSLEKAVKNGGDIEARENMMWAAMLAGLAFGAAGTAAAHALQYPVGALTHTAHGLGVACLLPYVMEYNRPNCIPELVQIADAMNVKDDGRGQEARADNAINAVESLFVRVGIPATIRELGLADDQLDWAASEAMGAARLVKNNPRPLDVAAMSKILLAAQTGNRASLRLVAA